MVLTPGTSPSPELGPRAIVRLLWRELLLPAIVVFALFLIAVALIEGPPLEQFLYAVF